MIELGSFRNTAALPVTDEPALYTSPGPHSIYVVWSDRSVRLTRNDIFDAERSFLLREGVSARLRIEKNEVLSFALAEGETDGTIYITEAS